MTGYHYRAPQELHLLSILAQTASRRASGCLRVTDTSNTWMLYLEQGKLVHAYSSLDPFGRLDRYLRRLSAQVPSLASPVRVQVRLLFQKPYEEAVSRCGDYEAICWLVEQQYLTQSQAAQLVEAIAKEVLESLLPLQFGNYNLLVEGQLEYHLQFCRLDLRTLVEACQVKRQRQQFNGVSKPIARVVPSPSLHMPRPGIQPPSVMPPSVRQPVAPASQNPGVSPPQDVEIAAPPQPKTYTIACIDDSPTVLSAIESFLDDKAFKVLRIDNPVSALMKIIRNKPDLILLDVTMPSLDGYELCSLLRRHTLFKQTPIIMVTGNTGLIDRAKAKLVGSSGYLTKPFTQPDLLKVIFKHLT
ncbi:MAG: response regulator [Cyanobacteria bacterium P01_F01_bin.86]